MSRDEIESQIINQRKEKDGFFRLSHQSPIPHEERHSFTGLIYFPYGSSYRVNARFTKKALPESIMIETSKGHSEQYFSYGHFEFEMKGKMLKLQVYKPSHHHGEGMLFVPFRDKTSGKETYGAGRYLDIPESGSANYMLDFNIAYNPLCVYSPDYACPLPPRENWLEIEIRAGEKNFKSD